MRQAIKAVLDRYGTDLILVTRTGEIPVRGFFQAVNTTSWQRAECEAIPLGTVLKGQYTYVGPADTELTEGDSLRLHGKEYLFLRAEKYYYGNQAAYQWGLCVRKGGEDTWGNPS